MARAGTTRGAAADGANVTGNAARPRARAWAAGVARGFCVGAADLVPGVSGATVAVVLGIYERLVAAIRAFDLPLAGRLLRLDLPGAARHVDVGFLLPLAVGVGLAAAFFTRVVSLAELLETHRLPVQSFFFGLVAGALGVLAREARRGHPLRGRDLATGALGLAAGWGVAVAVPASTPEAAWFVFAAGACAAGAMILPGVSGAYVLVLLKKYAYVLAALGRLDLAVLVPFGLGVAIGLALLSRVLGWLLGRHRRPTLFALAGLVAGSLWSLWPYRAAVDGRSVPAWPEAFGPANVLLAAAGMALVAVLHLASRRRKPDAETGRGPP